MKYEFKLSIPFNDENSTLWWKPDEKEEIPESADSTIDSTMDDTLELTEPRYRYYNKYEKERFLRWFGTDHVPELDLNNITKKTMCSIPKLTNDI